MDTDPKAMWTQSKELIGWTKSSSPRIIVHEGKTITAPQEIADKLNFCYVSRSAKFRREMKTTDTDPLVNYKNY